MPSHPHSTLTAPDELRAAHAHAHLVCMTRPALLAASSAFLDEIAARLTDADVLAAVASRDPGPLYYWLVGLIALQGISDEVAFAYDARHGGVSYDEVTAALDASPSCPRLRSYWSFECCGYRKGADGSARTCAEPGHLPACPLPRHRLRKGALNVAAYGLALFIRDLCGGDLVGWIDGRLAGADPGVGAGVPVRERAAVMREALLGPLCGLPGTGRKLWSMILAELLLAGDPSPGPAGAAARERWRVTGASMVAVDTLVHAFLHRTGTLDRLGAMHPYGPACYAPGGCAEILHALAEQIDARAFNPAFPPTFPRFVQHAIRQFCARGGWDLCNGNRIDDRGRCEQERCPSFGRCDRVAYKMNGGVAVVIAGDLAPSSSVTS